MSGDPQIPDARRTPVRGLAGVLRERPRAAVAALAALVAVALLTVTLVPGGRLPGAGTVGPVPATEADRETGAERESEEEREEGGARDPGEELGEEFAEALEHTNGEAALAFRHTQLVDESGDMSPSALIDAKLHVDAMRTAADGGGTSDRTFVPEDWEWLGPGNIGGRIRAILVHPTDPDTLWVGSATGGIFKTTNGGVSWTHLDDFMANLAVSSLVMHPAEPDVIYAATGENTTGNIDDGNRGAGVFVSQDGGTSWQQLASTAAASSWWYTNRLAMHPSSATSLLAATWGGIFRTSDGGASWPPVLTGQAYAIQDIDYDPIDGNNAVAGSFGSAYYSTDGGASWQVAAGLPAAGRVELAYARSNPSIVYASVNANGGAIYRSADGGHAYVLVGPTAGDNYLGGQGNYDNALWVSPTNPNRVIVGGIDLWQSVDGGATLTRISDWRVNQNHVRLGTAADSAHADHHAIVANANYPTDTTVYFGNDGGIYRTADVTTVTTSTGWQELNNNLGTTQFYGAGGNAATGRIIGGTQDNGTLLYTGGTEAWTMTAGGDGGPSMVDPLNPDYLYGEYVYASVLRSSDGGATSEDISGLTGFNADGSFQCVKPAQYEIADMCTQTANFIAPMRMDPASPATLLVGGMSLWRTTNARAANSAQAGPVWAAIRPSAGSAISAIAIDATDSNNVYIGQNNGQVFRSTNATAVSPGWTSAGAGALPGRIVLGLTIDPNDPNVVYAMYSGFAGNNLWRSTNGGSTWTDRTGSGVTGLPDVPVRTLVVHPGSSAQLYVGTEIGVFTSQDAGATWSAPGGGPANVPVDELFVMGGDLVAATFGRGLFRAPLSGGPANTAPTISDIVDQGTPQDTAKGPVAFTIGDTQTAAASLTVSGASSNQAVVPNAGITFGGAGASRTVTVTPAAGQTGSATITVTVSDGALSASDTFLLTVTAVTTCTDDAREPDDTIGSAKAATSGQSITGMACDDDYMSITAAAGQTITASLELVHANGDLDLRLYTAGSVQVGISESASDSELIVFPVSETGTYVVQVYPYAGAVDQNAYTLTITVPPLANTAPTISDTTDRVTPQDTSTGAIAFTVGDEQTSPGSLSVTATSSDQAVVPDANIVLGGTGASRTVTITPAAAATGSATITLAVSDGALTANDTFLLTVTPATACVDDANEPDDGLLTATPILAGDIVLGVACDDDFHSIATSAGQTLTARLEFTHADGDLDMRLYNAAGTQVGSSLGSTDVEQVSYAVGTAGTYYVRVYPYLGAANQNAYALGVTLADTAPPVAVSRGPAPGSTGVARDTAPLLGFNEPLAPATVTGSTFRMKDLTAGTWVTATLTYDGTLRRIRLRPAALLAAGHRFTVYATSGIRDVAGNAYAGSSWSFTASGDKARPTITGRKPASGATGVSRTTNVLVTFSEAMRSSTITTATVRLRDSVTGATVTASVSYDATRRRTTLNPSATLAARRTYTVLISSSIRDRAGNRLSSSSWSFRTGS